MGVKTRKLGNINDQLVQWQAVVTASTLSASVGNAYFIDTTSNACTVTLPANGSSTAGDTIMLKDYARNWGTNAVNMASNTFDGIGSQTPSFSTTGQTVTFVHMGSTKGWSLINDDTVTGLGAEYVTATGGTVTTADSNYKVHTFTGDGCFVVSSVGNPSGSTKVDYLVIAGGGAGGGMYIAGGGGAGGFRESHSAPVSGPYTASPLASATSLPVGAQTYPVTVGAGGTGNNQSGATDSTSGSNSVFSTITSAGGGYGKQHQQNPAIPGTGGPGGSGGGANGGNPYHPALPPSGAAGGTGNTPPVSPSQGNNGGTGSNAPPNHGGGGGGGATAVGQDGGGTTGGNGGAGATTSISGSAVARGGGGGASLEGGGTAGSGGTGGGGAGNVNSAGVAGTVNTGGGGGGTDSRPGPNAGGAGGTGIVIIRYKFQ